MRDYAQTIPALKERGLREHAPEIGGHLTDELLSACIEVSGVRSRFVAYNG